MLVLSKGSDLLPLAVRLEAPICVWSRVYRGVGEGLVERVPRGSWPPGDGLVSSLGMGTVLKKLSLDSWGGGEWADLLTDLPSYGRQLMEAGGVDSREEIIGGVWTGEELLYAHSYTPAEGFMDGGVGSAVLAGCVVEPTDRGERVEELVGLLKRAPYRGPVRLGSSLQAGVNVAELSALMELFDGSLGDLVAGSKLRMFGQVGLSIRISLPPFPNLGDVTGQVLELDPPRDRHIWWTDLNQDQVGLVDGNLGWVSARGEDIQEARRRVYRTIKGLSLAGLQYRGDVGKVASVQR